MDIRDDQSNGLSALNNQPVQAVATDERLPKQGLDRFVKIGPQGEHLPPNAKEWVALLDKEKKSMWEIKTGHGLHKREYRFANGEKRDSFGSDDLVKHTNDERLAGADDWRMPEFKELQDLWSAIDYLRDWGIGKEAVWYWSSTINDDNKLPCLLRFRGGYRSSDFASQEYAVRLIRKLID